MSASRVDITPAGLTYIRRYPAGLKRFLKPVNTLLRRSTVIKLLGTVVRNEVDLDPRELIAVEQGCKFTSVGVRIVHAAEHYIFERKALAAPQRTLKFLRRRHQFVEVPFPIYRHQRVAKLIFRRRQRYGEMRTVFELGKFVDLRHDARSRDRNAIWHDEKAVFARHYLERGDQILEIQKWLARSHSDQIRPVRRLASDAVNVVQYQYYLLNDLAGG